MGEPAVSEEDEFESLLDELTGSGPIEEPGDDDEPAPIAAEEETETPSDEPEEEEPAKAEEEPEADETEEEPADEEEPEEDPEPEADEDEPAADEPTEAEAELAAERKKNEALQKRLYKLREKKRALQQQAPPPTRMPEPPPTPPPAAAQSGAPDLNRIPVTVDESGEVYIDRGKVQQIYEEASRPTPEQLKQAEIRNFETQFVASHPDRGRDVINTAREAEQFITLALETEAGERGFRPRPGNEIADMQWFLRDAGIADQVEEFFPDIAPVLEEFSAAFAMENVPWMRSVLERVAASGVAESDPEPTPKPKPRLRSVKDAPRSMARAGGSRSTSPNADEAEFDKLEKQFQDDPAFMPDKKYTRYKALGKKLGKTGLE